MHLNFLEQNKSFLPTEPQWRESSFFRSCEVKLKPSEKGRVQENKGNVMTVCSAPLLKNARSNLN